ncbi:hypothetical protein LTR09_010666 [Extremus antarcticus]|uniref:LITAF domain-containing protein n=1 Tax=Extremus antarcticus TaxID=702011 RepID=A0AAJ0DDF1_9PEZI|nr:hypothetical protein LTR09_010666 [Extremus antarcticus]
MAYQPPQQDSREAAARTAQPVPEQGPRMVTPRNKVGSSPTEVDCPYCRTVVKTEVREVDAEDTGFMQCLICLVCWPMLFCYESNKHLDHICSVCKRQLTHRPHGSTQTIDVAIARAQPDKVPSQWQQSS